MSVLKKIFDLKNVNKTVYYRIISFILLSVPVNNHVLQFFVHLNIRTSFVTLTCQPVVQTESEWREITPKVDI